MEWSRTLLKSLIIAAALLFVATGASASSYSSTPKFAPVAYGAAKTAQYNKKDVIPPSEAAQIAGCVAPRCRLLTVRLSRGSPPRYVIRARKQGQVIRIIINALTGDVLR